MLFRSTQARIGCTVLLITHDQNVAKRCRRHLRMEDGRLQSETLVHAAR